MIEEQSDKLERYNIMTCAASAKLLFLSCCLFFWLRETHCLYVCGGKHLFIVLLCQFVCVCVGTNNNESLLLLICC